MSGFPEPPWRKKRPSAPRTQLSRDVIVDAALKLLDAEGIEAVSMRRVAEELGSGAASLYWHVANKDDLLDLVLDRIIGEMTRPTPTDDWQADIKAYGHEARRVLNSHRDVARITLARIPTGQNAITNTEWLLARLASAGLPERAIAYGMDAMFLFVNAFCYEESMPFRVGGASDDQDEALRQMGEYFAALPADRFPNFVSFAGALTEGTVDDRFDFGLELLVKGLASFAE